MNYIRNILSPRVDLIRMEENTVPEIIPPTQVLDTEESEPQNTETQNRSHSPSGMDLSNLEDPPKGIKSKKKPATEGT